jgi:hypothetical protein
LPRVGASTLAAPIASRGAIGPSGGELFASGRCPRAGPVPLASTSMAT